MPWHLRHGAQEGRVSRGIVRSAARHVVDAGLSTDTCARGNKGNQHKSPYP